MPITQTFIRTYSLFIRNFSQVVFDRVAMKSFWFFVLVLMLSSVALQSQNAKKTYRVFFRNKGVAPFVKGSSLYTETLKSISQRALTRRAKVLPKDSIISVEDAPLYQPYLDVLVKSGAKILLQLRWKNYAVVEMDTNTAALLKVFRSDVIKDITPTASILTTLQTEQTTVESSSDLRSVLDINNCGEFKYGASWTQHKMLHTYELHNMGITGVNSLIGVLDNGFRWKAHNATKTANVLGEYDFMFQDSITANESNDVGSQDGHGSPVFSTICGWEPDSVIGVAPFAQFMLAKTEDMRFEKRIEEDNYAAGLEWLERNGADVTTSSLGYFRYDTLEIPYNYNYLNGRTTIAAQAVNHAVKLGVTCITAAGNSGGTEKTIITPADADSVITVGAFRDDSLHVAGFTSKGPTAEGKIKPTIAALGVGVRGAHFSTETATAGFSGTSFATPLIGGCVGLLHSAFPEITPYQVRDILTSTATQATAPDNSVGHGCPNVMAAAEKFGIVISPFVTYEGNNNHHCVVFYIRSLYPITKATLFINDAAHSKWIEYPLQKTGVEYQYLARVYFHDFTSNTLQCFLEVNDSLRSRRAPFTPTEYYTINKGDNTIPCGIKSVDLPTSVSDFAETPSQKKIAVERSAGQVNLTLPSTPCTIIITDALGKTVQQLSTVGTSQFIPITSLTEGLYTISIVTQTSTDKKILLLY